jgi:hypothetical protein
LQKFSRLVPILDGCCQQLRTRGKSGRLHRSGQLASRQKDRLNRSALFSLRDLDYELPWFSKEFNNIHKAVFHAELPEVATILTVDGKSYAFDKNEQDQS